MKNRLNIFFLLLVCFGLKAIEIKAFYEEPSFVFEQSSVESNVDLEDDELESEDSDENELFPQLEFNDDLCLLSSFTRIFESSIIGSDLFFRLAHWTPFFAYPP
jgi:hypothetical protein